MTEQTLCIIPCAGYGVRMGMKPNESKEMLLDPKTGKPLIDYSLDLCKKYNLKPLIITRPEKTDLIEYINKRNNTEEIALLTINDLTGEWPETILRSELFWNENNILMLPDIRFQPESAIDEINNNLIALNIDYVFGVHTIEVNIPWGIIEFGELERSSTTEKPTKYFNAWGIIGFKKDTGRKLFESYSNKGTRNFIDNFIFVDLYGFKDITREGKIEDY